MFYYIVVSENERATETGMVKINNFLEPMLNVTSLLYLSTIYNHFQHYYYYYYTYFQV